MKVNGRLENWSEYETPHKNGNARGLRGQIFGLRLGAEFLNFKLYPDGSNFNLWIVTEPPYFKSRIVTSSIGNFYVLGEPLNKEDNLV